jgi:TonB-dependent Receptor Plug Domain
MRWPLLVLVGLLLAPAVGAVTPAPEGPALKVAIARQSLSSALDEFCEQTGLEHGFLAAVGARQQSRGARAGLKPAAALEQLLAGTGLQFQFETEHLFTILPSTAAVSTEAPRPMPVSSPEQTLEEVMVTANRRLQRANRLPMSISVLTHEDMTESGIKVTPDIAARTTGMEFDYLSYVGAGVYTNMAVRGVTDRHGTVTEIFLDDIPIPEVRSNTFGRALPAAFDLDRSEVVRGPQGTIMGANTQGGAIRYVPNQPSMKENLSAGAESEWAITDGGAPSYEAGSWLDSTLVRDTVGIRLSGWYRSDGGYVSRVNPFTCFAGTSVDPANCSVVDSDADRITSRSFRGILTFKPTESVTITPALSYEANSARDSSAFFTYLTPDPAPGDLYNGSLFSQPAADAFYLSTLKITADFAATELTAVSSYFDRTGRLRVDDTESIGWGGWNNPYNLGPEYPASYGNAITTTIGLTQRTFSQEVRLASKGPPGAAYNPNAPPDPSQVGDFTWFMALSFAGARYREADHVVAPMVHITTPLVYAGPLDIPDTTTTVQNHWALFGDATRTISRGFSVNAGLRLEHDDYSAHDLGMLGGAPFQQHAAEYNAVPRLALTYSITSSIFPRPRAFRRPAWMRPCPPACCPRCPTRAIRSGATSWARRARCLMASYICRSRPSTANGITGRRSPATACSGTCPARPAATASICS